MKRKPLLFFFIIWLQSRSLRYNFGPGALLSSSDYRPRLQYNIVKTYPDTCAIFGTRKDDPVFMGSTVTEMCHKVFVKQSVKEEITVLMNLFKMPAVMLCVLHWLLPHRNLPQPSFILPHNPQHAPCRTLKHCNS